MDAIFTMRVSLQKRFRFQKDTWVLFVDFDKAFDTVPRRMTPNPRLLPAVSHRRIPILPQAASGGSAMAP